MSRTLITLALALFGSAASAAPRPDLPADRPASFEANLGQAADPVKFLVRGSGHSLLLTDQGSVLMLRKKVQWSGAGVAGGVGAWAAIHMQLQGAAESPAIEGVDALDGKVNYLLGADRRDWLTEVPTWRRVAYRQVYPGVDLVFRGDSSTLEYDFVVAPGADPAAIAFQFAGADRVELGESGEIVMHVVGEQVRSEPPHVYQEVDGQRRVIASRYVLDGQTVRFELGEYDRAAELVIDPVLVFSSYLGGPGQEDHPSIAIDGDGSVYIAGTTESTARPQRGTGAVASGGSPFPPAVSQLWPPTGEDDTVPPEPSTDAFVAKFSQQGDLVYRTHFGGRGSELADPFVEPYARMGVAIDGNGRALVAGTTTSHDFPVTSGALATRRSGASDAFLVQLDARGQQIEYATLFGGSGADAAVGVSIAADGSVTLAGNTDSPELPPVAGVAVPCDQDAFLVWFAPGLTHPQASMCVGGRSLDIASDLYVDDAGTAWLAGATLSSDFPVTHELWPDTDGWLDAFVFGVNPGNLRASFSTVMSGSSSDWATGVAVDEKMRIHLVGVTQSDDLPVTEGAADTAFGGRTDGWVVRLDPDGTDGGHVGYASYLGGSGDDYAMAIDVASSAGNRAYVTGTTTSEDFPQTGADRHAGIADAFLTVFDEAGSSHDFSSRFGGEGMEIGWDVAIAGSDVAVMAGTTNSRTMVDGPDQADVFVAKVVPNRPPVADAGDPITAVCDALGLDGVPVATVVLDGSASTDPDGEALGYTWTGPFPEGDGEVTGVDPEVTLEEGVSTLELVVDDGLQWSEPAVVDVQVYCEPQANTALIHQAVKGLETLVAEQQRAQMLDYLDKASANFQAGRTRGGARALDAFADYARMLIVERQLDEAEGRPLVDAARDLIAGLEL